MKLKRNGKKLNILNKNLIVARLSGKMGKRIGLL
jgi:translation initiation factor IF-1